MKLGDLMKTVKALIGDNVLKASAAAANPARHVTRPDIVTQVRFRKEERNPQRRSLNCVLQGCSR
jgi:hypothetical protein